AMLARARRTPPALDRDGLIARHAGCGPSSAHPQGGRHLPGTVLVGVLAQGPRPGARGDRPPLVLVGQVVRRLLAEIRRVLERHHLLARREERGQVLLRLREAEAAAGRHVTPSVW